VSADLHAIVAARLHADGQRYTPQRRRLVDILSRAGSPLALPQVLKGGRGLAQSSVYRNLVALERAKVVRRVLTEEEFGRYELAEDLTGHHHHLICANCGTVEDVTIPAPVEATMRRTMNKLAGETGWSTVGHRLDLIGTCRDCG
jgi:Fur family ferric uptake transcriptional regulator